EPDRSGPDTRTGRGLARSPRRASRVMVLLDDFASLLSDVPYHDCLGKHRERWLVVRSFNKAFAPDLRVAVTAADADTSDRLAREQWLADGWVSIYLQRVAAAALGSRSVSSLLRRARQVYALRRSPLNQ